MADQAPPSPSTSRRRSSFADIFTSRPVTASTSPPSSTAVPQPAAVPLHKRGMSISTLGLSGGSPTPASPYTAFAKHRRESVSTSTGSTSPELRNSYTDEPVVVEEDEATRVPLNTPLTPSFARRVSFGAQALRDVRQGSVGGAASGGRRPSASVLSRLNEDDAAPALAPATNPSPPTAKTGGEGFNWSEALRDRTKRSPSFSSAANPFAPAASRPRAPSVAAVEPPKEMPIPMPAPMPMPAATPTKVKQVDHLGERMLRGDFMMD